MQNRILIISATAIVVFLLFAAVGAQIERQISPAPAQSAQQVEYMMVHPQELGLDLHITRRIDYDATTALFNQYASQGWRVREFGMFDYPAVLLERDVIPPSP